MARRIRDFDWSRTSLGPPAGWPRSLKTALSIALGSRYPIWLGWGRELVKLYNDPYIPVLGKRHDYALGASAPVLWQDIWEEHLALQADAVLLRGEASWNDQRQMVMHRNGYAEETYFTFSFSPIPADEGGVGGLFCACTEDTHKVLGERRLAALRSLAAATADARTERDACTVTARLLAEHGGDVAFALIYLIEGEDGPAILAGRAGPGEGASWAPGTIALGGQVDQGPWPLALAWSEGKQILRGIPALLGLPGGIWPESASTAAVLPLARAGHEGLRGFLIAGASPRLPFDDRYESFFDLLARSVADALSNARAYEEEKRRAEALAELDKAKTQFLSNISHEFRTPLTLMLGPVEDLLAAGDTVVPPPVKGQLEVVHRNSLRLLRLVNTMLDFSRIEAGRVTATYEPVDLPALTAELASSFRSACERAGLRLLVHCPPLDAPMQAFVDRDMWEKIVLNLLSNAFKFTMEGEIEVRMERCDDIVRLVVRDTGVGIPAEELPRMFERFHRVGNVRGRTHEGTGIGLALVQELARLHGGTVAVQSMLGEGSRFTVTLPLGKAHLDPDRVRGESTADGCSSSGAFVAEAMRWLPGEPREERLPSDVSRGPGGRQAAPPPETGRPLVLWADDNADMREYVARLLGGRFEVEPVADGLEALQAARRRAPELVLTDVMMPRLDGFGLLRELRSDPALCDTPVIMISARAGEEARIEGVQAGVDDYLIKPFSARELLARVEAHARMARMRREAREAIARSEEALREADRRKDDFLATLSHELRNPLAPIRSGLHVLRLAGADAETRRRALGMMERQVTQMVRLVDDLLEVSRITRGTIELRKQTVDLAEVVRAALESSAPAMDAARLRLIVDLPPEPLMLRADAVRLSQVLVNLLHNASKYTDEGGEIRLVARAEGAMARVSVRDTGIGIHGDLLPRVFDPFVQGEDSFQRGRTGLGIGLTLVRRLVELHGGSVEAGSQGPGRGAEFTVLLPLCGDGRHGAEAPRLPDPPAGAGPPLRILVVDDSRDAADSLVMMLGMMGHDLRTTYDGRQAIGLAEHFRPDLVLLDIGMPEMSGHDVARRIRKEPWGRAMVLVALTGWGQEDDRRRSREAGFDTHLVKPVDPADLVRMIGSLRGPGGLRA